MANYPFDISVPTNDGEEYIHVIYVLPTSFEERQALVEKVMDCEYLGPTIWEGKTHTKLCMHDKGGRGLWCSNHLLTGVCPLNKVTNPACRGLNKIKRGLPDE